MCSEGLLTIKALTQLPVDTSRKFLKTQPFTVTVLHSQGLKIGKSKNVLLSRCMECRRGLAMRSLSVRLSVKRVHCDKTEEKSLEIFIPCERSFGLVF